jgi:hypothetical protein
MRQANQVRFEESVYRYLLRQSPPFGSQSMMCPVFGLDDGLQLSSIQRSTSEGRISKESKSSWVSSIVVINNKQPLSVLTDAWYMS